MSFLHCRGFVRRRSTSLLRTSLLLLMLGGGVAFADVSPASFVARNGSQYWNAPGTDRNAHHPMDMEAVVYFYDPDWRLFWAEVADGPSWFDTTAEPLPLKPGQRVRIKGTYTPSKGFGGDTVSVEVLSERAMPQPVVLSRPVDNARSYDARFVSGEGYVISQQEVDPNHVQYDFLIDGRVIPVTLLVQKSLPVPQLTDCHVRLQFVYVSRRDESGVVRNINGWMPSSDGITMLGHLRRDARFDRTPTNVQQLTEHVGQVVKVTGEIQSYEPGYGLTVRDATGQVLVRTEQLVPAGRGERVEVIGVVEGTALHPVLADPVCRTVSQQTDTTTPGEGLRKFRLIDQVLLLRNEEAANKHPALLKGLITWSDPNADFFYIQDSTGGIRVRTNGQFSGIPRSGSVVTIHATTGAGPSGPELELHTIEIVAGDAELKTPQMVTLDAAIGGAFEGRLVQVRGHVRAVTNDAAWSRFAVTTATGEFEAVTPRDPEAKRLVGAVVRVTGVCAAANDDKLALGGIRLWSTGARAIHVEAAAPDDPFSAPERSIASFRQYRASRLFDGPVRATGVVTYCRPGALMYLQHGNAGLLVLHRDAARLTPGDAVEVVGVPGHDGIRPLLREYVWRRAAALPPVTPIAVSTSDESAELEGRLVKLTGRLLESVATTESQRLLIRDSERRVEAFIDGRIDLANLEVGARIEVTGVYVPRYDEARKMRGFGLYLRGADDIRVLEAPSWWTTGRALAVAAGFALCTFMGVAWVVVLRRRVRQQTEQIRAQLEKQAQMDSELERAARLESLGVLAGGIAHDFNNLLTVIIANLGLAAMDERVRAAAGKAISEAERGAMRAADLTQQLLTFAKGGDPVRRAVNLPEIVRESAEFARHGSRVRCVYEFEPNLPPAEVDRGQISRVVHNLVLNATQAMSDGGLIWVVLAPATVADGEDPNLSAGRYVKLSVCDEGQGIAPEHLARVFEPYFSTKAKNSGLGLATVHSIVKKHRGHIRVQSKKGQGTRFDIWLPAAAGAPVEASAPAAPRPAAQSRLRVLFMDDEEVIRRTAEWMFKQLGHDATIVADGNDAVREYEAALKSGLRYDVVVLDLTVPGGLGGRATMEALLQMDPHVCGIVSSGYSNDPVLADYNAFGFKAVVPKPYFVADMARALQQVAASAVPNGHPAPARQASVQAPSFR